MPERYISVSLSTAETSVDPFISCWQKAHAVVLFCIIKDDSQAWGKGLCADVKRTVLTHWVSEMTNFNQKTVAVSLLMFITVIAPTLTFGAVYSTNMDNRIGAVECILATCWTGCFFSLFGGMPTVIVGSTVSLLGFGAVGSSTFPIRISL